MVHFRWPADLLDLDVRLLPGWRLCRFLRPVSDGRFVTPFQQAVHYFAMHSSQYVCPHGSFRIPNCACPKNISIFPEDRDTEVPGGLLGLSSSTNRLYKKCRKVTPRSNAQAGNGNERHVLILRQTGGGLRTLGPTMDISALRVDLMAPSNPKMHLTEWLCRAKAAVQLCWPAARLAMQQQLRCGAIPAARAVLKYSLPLEFSEND